MSKFRRVAEKFAKETTRVVGQRWGESFPFYYVSEYPKSGGTWLARMVSDYLQLPFPQYALLPIGFSCVLQNHWRYHPGLRRVFYLYRDGRDVMTSYFFDRLRVARYSDRPGGHRLARIYEGLLGEDYDPADSVRLLPKFMEYEFSHPGRGCSLSWAGHVRDWYDPENRPHIAYLSYEELLADTEATLSRAVEHVCGEKAEAWKIEGTVEKFSMKRQTGRRPGEEDHRQHIRKGVAGDWKNHFSRESAELFDELAGDELVDLGYERDRSWVDHYDYVTA